MMQEILELLMRNKARTYIKSENKQLEEQFDIRNNKVTTKIIN